MNLCRLICLFCLSLPVLSGEYRPHPVMNGAYHTLLKASFTKDGLGVTADVRQLTHRQPPVNGPFMSRPLQEIISVIALSKKKRRWPLSFGVTLTVRDLDGYFLDQVEWVARTRSGKLKGQLYSEVQLGSMLYKENKFTVNTPFEELLKFWLSPVPDVRLALPENDYFLLELRYDEPFKGYSWPDRKANVPAPYPLGVAYCEVRGESIDTYSNIQVRLFEQARDAFARVDEAWKIKDMEAVEEGLTYFMEQVPSSRNGAESLLDFYTLTNPAKARAYAWDYQPFFARWHMRDPYKSSLNTNESKLRRLRKQFSEAPDAFPLNTNAWLEIKEPAHDDLISGTTEVTFVVHQKGKDNPILRAVCFADGRQLSHIDGPPQVFRVNAGGNGSHELRVVAFFQDGTRSEDTVKIKSIATYENQRVDLSEMQVVALDKKGWPTTLDDKSVEISQDGTPLKVSRIWRDKKPLDVVVLVDTSGSMSKRIYQSQFAVYGFLEKMGKDESASIYSYDDKVMQVKRFTNDLDETAPNLFSLIPMGRTALYDALLVARCKLMARPDSTKAVIVLGDGKDTASRTSSVELLSAFDGTPIRVYAIQHWSGGPKSKWPVLSKLANQTGGLFWKLKEEEHPEKALERILAELRNLHFISYHHGDEKSNAPVKVKAKGKKLRALHVRKF